MFPSHGTANPAAPAPASSGLRSTPGGPPAAPPADLLFDAPDANFEAAVIERSMQVPVLLDCWAPWCGPCRSLTPVLEKVVAGLNGAVVLAKLNSDENPGLAGALQLRSIPAVFLLKGGQVVDQFTGALPEGQVRAFLARHLQPQVSPIDQLRAEAAEVGAVDAAEAEAMLREGLEMAPAHAELKLDLAERLIARDALDEAEGLLDSIAAEERNDRHASLQGRITMARNKPAGDATALAQRIAANAKDHEARFALAAIQAHAGDFNAAFDQLLEVVLRDKAEWRERARVQLVEWFKLCPDAAAVSRGRRYLGMYLN
jgi:putative thioredoxin